MSSSPTRNRRSRTPALLIVARRELRHRWWLQVAAFCLFTIACNEAVALAHVPLPGSILGLLLLLGALLGGVIAPDTLRRGAMFLLGHLMLFFVPPMLALLQHAELISLQGLLLLGVILFGTIATMVCTGLVVELCMRSSERRGTMPSSAQSAR